MAPTNEVATSLFAAYGERMKRAPDPDCCAVLPCFPPRARLIRFRRWSSNPSLYGRQSFAWLD